jgi:hypothetical protein
VGWVPFCVVGRNEHYLGLVPFVLWEEMSITWDWFDFVLWEEMSITWDWFHFLPTKIRNLFSTFFSFCIQEFIPRPSGPG